MDASLLQERLTLACHWLTEVAQVNTSAILEKVLSVKVAGGGSDASPYHIRDLGTIFFVQAAAQYLARLPQNKPSADAPADCTA